MQRIIAGGTGFIGQFLVERWLTQGIEVTIIGRDQKKISATFNNKVKALTWDDLQQQGAQALQSADHLINLVGANIGAKRWSEKRKQEILNSRVEATTKLSRYCAQLKENSPRLINANGVGIYGAQTISDASLPEKLDENSTIDCEHPQSFLANIGCQWEQATLAAEQANVPVVKARFGVVFGRGGGIVKNLYLPFYLGMGGKIGSGKQAISWIAIDDLANALEFIIEHKEINGAVNITSPMCVNQRTFAKAFAKALKRPCFMPMPEFMVNLLFGEMGQELLLSGQNVAPTRLLEAGFKFNFADIETALNHYLV